MKIGGIEIKGPQEGLLVLERDGQPVPFRTKALLDLVEFYERCPEPLPPVKTVKGSAVKDFKDKGYIAQRLEWNRRKSAWITLKTLEPSNIEWTSVDMEKPSTWIRYQDELKEAGFGIFEINRIINLVEETNCLDEDKIKWAREVFVQGQQQSQDS